MKMVYWSAAAGLSIALSGALPLGQTDARVQSARRPAHICAPDATPIYSCRFGARMVSVCAERGQLSYHYGRSARQRELTIAAGPGNRNLRYGTVIGQGGGFQEHLRFSNAGTHYIIYNGHNGPLSDDPDYAYSGLLVMGGDETISRRHCARPTVGRNGQRWWVEMIAGLPEEEDGGPFDGWF